MMIPVYNVGQFILNGYRIPYYIAGVLYTLASILLINAFDMKHNRSSETEDVAVSA